MLDGFAILDGEEMTHAACCIASWTRHAVCELTPARPAAPASALGEVPLPGVGTIGGVVERPEGGHEAWFGYTDHTTPSTIQHYDARTGEHDAVGHRARHRRRARRCTHQQVTYPSADGTTVRMFVIAPSTTRRRRAGRAPPDDPLRLRRLRPADDARLLRDDPRVGRGRRRLRRRRPARRRRGGRGLAPRRHARQQAERVRRLPRRGRVAHRAGLDDARAAPDLGGSNGGLLVGAALTQRPELYAAVVCSAPLLDMVRYEKFGLGATWNVEYGTAADPEELGWLLSYSPVPPRDGRQSPYPATLFTVFDGDTRVDPMHARKMCAALQHATSGQPTDPDPRRARRRSRRSRGGRSVELSADVLAFAAARTGLDLPAEYVSRRVR